MIGLAALEPRASLDDGGDHEDGAGGGKGKDSHPPAKRYRLTDQIKAIIWQLVCLSNECCRIENEKKCVARLSFSPCSLAVPEVDHALSSLCAQRAGGLEPDRE